MQQKLCFWLCPLLLFGVLFAGNPFLGARAEAAPLAAPGRAGPPDVEHGGVHLAFAVPPPAPVADGAVKALGIVPVNASAASARLLHGGAGTLATLCPDPDLRPLVECVEHGEGGEPVWVLRDGRRLVRNPRGDLPLLVPAK